MENTNLVCEACGRPYTAIRRKQRFCTPFCRYRYWTRHRHEVKAIENEAQLWDSCEELRGRYHDAVGDLERVLSGIDRLQAEAHGLMEIRTRLVDEQSEIEQEIKELCFKREMMALEMYEDCMGNVSVMDGLHYE